MSDFFMLPVVAHTADANSDRAPMSFKVRISEEQFAVAGDLADQTLRLFAGRPGYYNNNRNSHLRGKLGEIAATQVLSGLGLECETLWADIGRLAEADIEVPGVFRADVKTWSAQYWADMGRCVAVGQVQKLAVKADLIIWCVSEPRLQPHMAVEVRGWNSIADVEAAPRRLTGPATGRKVDNRQIDEAVIRVLEDLRSYGRR
ncbi:MAG: hypothetical protein HN750_13095 [Gemmatimonadales bacterium]|nr:hypothetical protein [Gemmatimonadales bacterium]